MDEQKINDSGMKASDIYWVSYDKNGQATILRGDNPHLMEYLPKPFFIYAVGIFFAVTFFVIGGFGTSLILTISYFMTNISQSTTSIHPFTYVAAGISICIGIGFLFAGCVIIRELLKSYRTSRSKAKIIYKLKDKNSFVKCPYCGKLYYKGLTEKCPHCDTLVDLKGIKIILIGAGFCFMIAFRFVSNCFSTIDIENILRGDLDTVLSTVFCLNTGISLLAYGLYLLKPVLRRLRQNAHNDEDSLFSMPADTTCKNCGCIINGDEEICPHCGEKLR